MHQSRQKATTRLPIRRKGTQYVAVASSSLENSVPVVIAVRDILNLARTKKEVKNKKLPRKKSDETKKIEPKNVTNVQPQKNKKGDEN